MISTRCADGLRPSEDVARVAGVSVSTVVRQRRKGIRQALEKEGIAWRPDRVLAGTWSEAWGHEAVERLLRMRPGVDAIFAAAIRSSTRFASAA